MKQAFTLLISLVLVFSGSALAQNPTLTLSMANAFISGTAPNQKLEFDIMMACNQSGVFLSSGQVYVDYNTTAFGSSVVTNNNLVVTRGTILSTMNAGSFKYQLGNFQGTVVDNTSSKVSSNFFSLAFGAPNSNIYEIVPTTATPFLHFAYDISNINQNAGLQFDQINTAPQFFWSDPNSSPVPGLPVAFTVNFGADYNTLSISSLPQLPLEGLIFRAIPEGKHLDIVWEVGKEVNNKGFALERSPDGEQFSEITWLDGAGTAENTYYSYTDASVAVNKTYYYRLRQVDLDGEMHYSPVIQGRIDASSALTVQVSPNPVVGRQAYFKVASVNEGPVSYKVSDKLGRIIARGTWQATAGTSRQHISMEGLAEGIYQVVVSDGIRQGNTSLIVK